MSHLHRRILATLDRNGERRSHPHDERARLLDRLDDLRATARLGATR